MRENFFEPKIDMYNPFVEPFKEEVERDQSKIVAKHILEYMISDDTKIVAKCTPCQCCACR